MKYEMALHIKFNKFPDIARAMPQEAADVQGRSVLMIVQAADPITPVGETGNLKNNKVIEPGGIGKPGFVHWLAPYAGFVNYGTRYMAARPFVDTAVAQVQPIFVQAMQELCKTGGL